MLHIRTMSHNMEDIGFRSDRREIRGRLFRTHRDEPPERALLFLHGLRSDQSGYLPRAARASESIGAVCVTFDLSGHGLSSGSLAELTPNDHLQDALAAYDYLATWGEPGRTRIGVCGASYGAFLAALIISRRSVQSLLMRAPALYADSDLAVPFAQRRRSGFGHQPRAALDNLADFGGSILIVESAKDDVIPHTVIQSYLDACRGRAQHHVIPDATHALTEERWRAEFLEVIIRWFSSM